MRSSLLRAALAALVLCASASAAQAARFVAVAKGQVASGVDTAGLFSPVGTNLTEFVAEATFVWETSALTYLNTGSAEGYAGGAALGSPSPVKSVTLSVGAVDYHFTPDYVSEVGVSLTGPPLFKLGAQLGSGAFGGPPARGLTIWAFPQDYVALNTPFSLDSHADLAFTGRFVQGGLDSGGSPVFDMTLDLVFYDIDVTAVPEPEAWALMLLGFGGLGVALRQARRGRWAPAA